jgi:hypothetical protein
MNQCDGCMARIPAINGTHQMSQGKYPDYMACTKDRYEEQIDKMLAESSTLPMCLMDESMDEELGT